MTTNEGIIGIYNYQNLVVGEEPAYYLLFLFNENGCLEHDFLMSLYEDLFSSNRVSEQSQFIGPFDGLDSVNKFAFKICDELSSPKITLHSVEEYNVLMEKSSNVNELEESLFSGGNVIENLDINSKKNIFSKIFN